jgi:NAD(P)-dependent dehydrogenase (short-subunit alcohol dehydrogenase family)
MTHETNGLYLVIGGTSGIGLQVAETLAQTGHQVAIAARNESRLAQIASQLGVAATPIDATLPDSIKAGLDNLLPPGRRLAGLVNCAGSVLLKPAHLTTDDEWHHTLHTNLSSCFYLLRESARRMMQQGGSIVFCSTVAAARGLPNHEAIAAAKAGVEGLTRSAAASYSRYQIRVNCVAPGLTETPLTQAITSNEASRKFSTAMHPLGRLGQPQDVASAITWLLSPQNSWITGQTLHIDGGLSTVQSR